MAAAPAQLERAYGVTNIKNQIPFVLDIEDGNHDLTQYQHMLFLSQASYAAEIIQRARMSECKPCSTPVDLKSKLAVDTCKPVANATEYRSLACALQYLTFTRPEYLLCRTTNLPLHACTV